MLFRQQTIVWGLVCRDNTIFVMEVRQVFNNIWFFKDYVMRVLIDPLSFLILICIYDLRLVTISESIYTSSFSDFARCLAQSSTEYIRILKLCFQFIDLGSRYFGPLSNISRREVLFVMLWSPVGLYMNGELVQVQSGGLGLKSSIFRSCNTCCN